MKATGIQIALVILGAFLGVTTWMLNGVHVAAILAAIAFGLALVLRVYLTTTRPERQWYDGRAVAESVKTLGWRFSVGGDPFALDAVHPVELFAKRIRDVMSLFADLTYGQADVSPQITDSMHSLRSIDLPARRRAYELHRIANQQKWYTEKADWNRQRAGMWAAVVFSAEGLGLVCAILRAAGVLEIDLLGLIAAVTIGASAWLQVKQHDSLARAYSVAAQELATIRSEVELQTSEALWSRWVDEAEEAISREHTPWRASRGVKGDLGRLVR